MAVRAATVHKTVVEDKHAVVLLAEDGDVLLWGDGGLLESIRKLHQRADVCALEEQHLLQQRHATLHED